MLPRFRSELRRPSPSFVLAAIALFVALGGTGAYAVDRVTSKEIGKGEVKRSDLGKNVVVSKKVAKDSLQGSDLAFEPTIATGNNVAVPPGGVRDLEATCQAGQIVSGGGWVLGSAPSDPSVTELTTSPWPPTNGGTTDTWLATVRNDDDNVEVTASAIALCLPG